MSPAELIVAAEMAESIASEMTATADALTRKGKAAAVRALLEEARRHTAEAIRLRAQAVALQQTRGAKPEDPELRA